MRGAMRALVACGLATAIAASTATAGVASTGVPSADTGTLTFIEALAALPDATRALSAARTSVAEAGARRATVRAAAIAAEAALSRANATASEMRLVQTRADRAALAAQEAIEDAARQMYESGGVTPSLAEVLLTADSEVGFARSLLTRRYLSSVSDDIVRRSERAAAATGQARQAVASATAMRDVALTAAVTAESTLVAADSDLAAARAAADRARTRHRELMRITRADRSADYGRIKRCGDWLTRLLARSGFEGENLREAWAIVMRESGGRADAVSHTNDLGLFQINTATWRKQPWFDRRMLLTKRYNATVAHTLSRGGRTWYSWGLDGHGRPDARAYVKAGWSQERIISSIVMPYVQWYAQYPCRPSYEKDAPSLFPPPPPPNSEEVDPDAPLMSDGRLAGEPEPEAAPA